MEIVTGLLLKLLLISLVFSVFEMALIQKLKTLTMIKKSWHLLVLNFIISFSLGIFFSMWFFDLNIFDSLWVSIFSFMGAPSIYEALKNQNLINYTPKSLSELNDTSSS